MYIVVHQGLLITSLGTAQHELSADASNCTAVNALGVGPWSDVLNVDSGADDLPNKPLSLQVLSDPAVGSRGFSIGWDMPNDNRSEGVLYYRLSMLETGVASPYEQKLFPGAIAGGGDWCKSGCTAAITAGVEPATEYTLTIQARHQQHRPGGARRGREGHHQVRQLQELLDQPEEEVQRL